MDRSLVLARLRGRSGTRRRNDLQRVAVVADHRWYPNAGPGGHPVRQHPAFLTGIGAPHGPRSSTRAPGGQVGHRRVFRRGCQAWDETDHSLIQNAEARDLPPELAPTFRHADEVSSASLRHILTLSRWLSTNKMVLFTT